ncbi:hypothetical protein HNR42_001588 [Deinobacterium chartae]|uniref:PEGA domain-containing protein n=1 Tax=Deinobacterium chartae TaxID=521158 RepID=A0A841HZ22_9DEIO|nr:PEGA domain-containing protein [Deinobacterium chartae]MBB6098163.1 hypothetical protein [Deinobacterium chartae]
MKKLSFALLAATAALLSTPAFAAPQISPQSIIVNPVPAEVGVSVWTDRDPGGNGNPTYRPGERIRLYVRTTQDAYVYLFNVDPNGKVDLILPNRYSGGDNFVRAGVTKMFPPENAGFTFDIAAPYGENKVLALASRTPLNIDDIARFQNDQAGGFAQVTVSTQTGLAQALSIVVNPVPQNSWITDTARYTVAPGGRPVAQTGSIRVESSPAGADVYLDGRLIGRTPLNIENVAVGRHDLRVVMSGYSEYRTSVDVGRNSTQTLRATLSRGSVNQGTGSLSVTSNVDRAEIFLNDRRAGRVPTTFRNLNPGIYRVRVTAPGYRDFYTTVEIRPGETSDLRVTLRR